jgi:hypothetical protein
VDIKLDYKKMHEDDPSYDNCHNSTSGFVEISAEAGSILCSDAYDYDDNDERFISEDCIMDECLFINRITHYNDTCVLTFDIKDGERMHVYTPFEPLVNGNYSFVDMSNCASTEIKDNGNILICFGTMSKAYTRVDNNYDELVLGWNKRFPDAKYVPSMLRGKVVSLSNNQDLVLCPRLSLGLELSNSIFKKQKLYLMCENYSNLTFDMSEGGAVDSDIWMSRLQNGKIHVWIDEGEVEFDCECIREYGEYRAKYDTDPDYDYEESDTGVYQKALSLELDALYMKNIAHKHYGMDGDLYSFERVRKAIDATKNGEISVDYLRDWLKFYSEIIEYSRSGSTPKGRMIHQIAHRVDKLFLDISYDKSLEEALPKIKLGEAELAELDKKYRELG